MQTWSEKLPGSLSHAGDLAGESEFTEGDTGETELTDVSTRAARDGTAILEANLRAVARKLSQLALSIIESLVGNLRVREDLLKLGTLGGVFSHKTDALELALNDGLLGHG
jgi:hypothetical protein